MAVTVSKSVAENWLHLDKELGTSVQGFSHSSLVEKSLMSSILFFIHKTMLTNRHIEEEDRRIPITFTTTSAIIFLIRYFDF